MTTLVFVDLRVLVRWLSALAFKMPLLEFSTWVSFQVLIPLNKRATGDSRPDGCSSKTTKQNEKGRSSDAASPLMDLLAGTRAVFDNGIPGSALPAGWNYSEKWLEM
jgi:hypothetical protein